MSLPCSRGWLDLQKFTVDACAGLGAEYSGIALAIRGELKTLVRDLPQVVEINLLDDAPAANAETKAWVQELIAESPASAAEGEAPAGAPVADNLSAPGWHRKFADSYDLAKASMKAGDPGKAVDIMTKEVAKQLSGRGQFFRKLQLIEICIAAGKTAVAQPIIDDLAASIETNHLDAWEDPATMAKALVLILRNSEKVQADDAEKQRLFQKIVRLDPVQAVNYLGN
jgi:type VI secretion system protein ImpA